MSNLIWGPPYPTADPQTLQLLRLMEDFTPEQRAFYVRVIERIGHDNAFFKRFVRETPIFRALFRAENYPALERWFNRRTLEVVKGSRGEERSEGAE